MTLYILEWDNGQEYADHDCNVLGIFSSEEKREQAKKEWEPHCRERSSPFGEGHFAQWEIELDKIP